MTDAVRDRDAVLQLCPHDHPPFADLCVVYARALALLGLRCTTVFFAPPLGTPVKGAIYLGARALRDTRGIASELEDRLPRDTVWRLAICHRYRSWWCPQSGAQGGWVLRASAVEVRKTVAVAHEFRFFDRAVRRLLVRFDRRTIFAGISPAVVQDLQAHVARCICWPNAVDVAREQAALLTRDEALQRLALPAGPFTVGVVGRLHPKKQPELALAAFRAAGLANARLVFVGDGPLRARLEQGDANVLFTGFVADARRCYRAFDALLLTSGDVEAFGMVALEGLVAGIPVVCQQVAGPADVLGELGFYYRAAEPADIAAALHRVQQSAAAAGDYRERAQARVHAEFSVEAMATRIADELNLPAPDR